MAFMEPQSLRPLPRHYYSPTYRGAATDVGGAAMSTLYKSRKMEGTLGGLMNVLLAGERASGTLIYGARKKMGFGAIDWIEQAEAGTYRRISPSEALGLRGYDDKFWTPRGIGSLAIDVVLDPTTYIGVGLVGKVGKLGGMAAKGGGAYLKFMGRPVMATARVTDPAKALWRAAPMYTGRASVLESLRTAFVPFHKLTQQVGAGAVGPFKEFYRATGVGRTKWDRQVQLMAKGVPEEYGAPIARYLERGEMPTSNIDEIVGLAQQQQAEYARMYQEKVSAGLLKQEQFIPGYMPHVPTEKAMVYAASKMPKLAGRRREATAALYQRSLKSAKERLITEDVFAANVYMQRKTGIENWFETDPFIALQKYGVEHIMGIQSEKLRMGIATRMGFKAMQRVSTKYTSASPAQRLSSLIKGHRLTQQENAMWSVGRFMQAGGKVDSRRFALMLEDLRGAKVFGDVRPGGMTPWSWMKSQFEMPVEEYGARLRGVQYQEDVMRKERLAIISMYETLKYASPIKAQTLLENISHRRGIIATARRSMAQSQTGADVVSATMRRRFASVERELMTPAGVSMRKYRAAYEASIGKIPGRRAITKKLTLDPTMERGGILYQLEKGYYIPTEAFAEYSRRIPTAGWGTRLETKFKKTLTSIWPAFHARNLYGIVGWQNLLAGVGFTGYKTNIDVMRKTSPWLARHAPWAVGDVGKMFDVPGMGRQTAAQMREIAEQAEVYGVTGMIDVSAAYSIKRGGTMAKLGRIYENVPQEMMVGVESLGRGALFWDRVMKGMPVPAAMADVEKFHFRYGSGALTAFESDYMRHGFLFYRWMRGNIPLQTQMSIEKPYMYAGLAKMYTRGSSVEERERLQDWQKERFGFTAGNTFVGLDLPFYEHPALMLNPSNWEDLYFAMTPAIKWPVGILAGRDPATGAPIEDWGDRKSYTASQFMGRGVYAQRELAKTWSGERPLSWTAMHQLGGVGVYEVPSAPTYSGMTQMPRMPAAIKKMGMTQDKWTEYQMARGWKPRLTELSRAEVYQQHGGTCSVCGRPCSPEHPCSSQLIVPVEQGGTYTQSNTALVCSSCSGTFRRNIAPMMGLSQSGLQVPSEYQTSFADRDKVFGIMDEYFSMADAVE